MGGDRVSKHYYMNQQRVATDITINYDPNGTGGGEQEQSLAKDAAAAAPELSPALANFSEVLVGLGQKPLDTASLKLPTIESYYPEAAKNPATSSSAEGNPSAPRILFWYHPDYLGNVDLITERDGNTHEFFMYNPWGEEMHQWNANTYAFTSPYRFNSKELDPETGLAYYGARYYQNKIGVWLSVDPMAHVAPGWSPFRAFYCNPIRYIDPTGMLEDDYGLDKQGNITLLRKTDDPTDKLIALDNDGNETDKSTEVDKGILSSKKTNTVTASNRKDYTFDQYKIIGDDKAKGLFEFVADNTEVEWSLTGVGAQSGTEGQNILTTSHIKDSEIGGGYLKAYGYTIREHSHSHPNHQFPSIADKKFAESLNLKFPKATLDIYHKGEYFQYDKNGLISVPTIVLPEIEIKVPKN
jgi:RHS repeat-associated protein